MHGRATDGSRTSLPRVVKNPLINRRQLMLAGATSALAEPSLRIIDTHTHFYDPQRPGGVPWPPKDDAVLYRTTMPDRYRTEMGGLVSGTVVVEASPSIEDNQWLLDLAKRDRLIVGVVGRLNPGTPEFARDLQRFSRNRLFRGIRLGGPIIAKGLGAPGFVSDFQRLSDRNLSLDAIGDDSMFESLMQLTDRIPKLRIIINHLPFDRQSSLERLRSYPRIYAKVSGVLRRIDGRVPADTSFYRDRLDELWGVFGRDRVVYGSNWPVSDRLAPYPVVLQVVRSYFEAKGSEAARAYFSKNAEKAYAL